MERGRCRAAIHIGDAIDERIYSSVRASMVGRETVIDIGPMSGEANVRHHLSRFGLAFDQATVDRVLDIAKRRNAVLSDAEILKAIGVKEKAESSGRITASAKPVMRRRPAAGER